MIEEKEREKVTKKTNTMIEDWSLAGDRSRKIKIDGTGEIGRTTINETEIEGEIETTRREKTEIRHTLIKTGEFTIVTSHERM